MRSFRRKLVALESAYASSLLESVRFESKEICTAVEDDGLESSWLGNGVNERRKGMEYRQLEIEIEAGLVKVSHLSVRGAEICKSIPLRNVALRTKQGNVTIGYHIEEQLVGNPSMRGYLIVTRCDEGAGRLQSTYHSTRCCSRQSVS
jgi:hypothetical protein